MTQIGHAQKQKRRGQQNQWTDGSVLQDSSDSPRMSVDKTRLEEIARLYIVRQLRENDFEELANEFRPVSDPDHDVHRLIGSICTQLEKERAEQFDEIIASLTVTNDNLEDTYRQLMTHVFEEGVNWGRIITFLVFSARLCLHCARYGLQDRVTEVVEWTESEMRETVYGWVVQRGGWSAFVEHYDEESWKLSLSTVVVVTGMVVAVLASGAFMMRRFLF